MCWGVGWDYSKMEMTVCLTFHPQNWLFYVQSPNFQILATNS